MTNALNHKKTEICNFIQDNFYKKMHAKRIESIENAVLGLMANGKTTIANIGKGYAKLNQSKPKHAIKQIDRLLSNEKLNIDLAQQIITQLVVAKRQEILVAMDWTNFTKDDQITLTAKLVTKHGRATPLAWLSVYLHELKGKKIEYENILLKRLKQYLPENIKVVILADREFGSIERFERLKTEYNFDYIIRFKKNTYVTYKNESKQACRWLSSCFSSRHLKNAAITRDEYYVAKAVIIKDPDMQEMWCLASSIETISVKTIKKYYSKRWSTECSYRDEKNFYCGFGLYKSRIKSTVRRDRLLIIIALAIIILTFLGHISEKIKLDKYIKANTAKTRTHSLFNQGLFVFSVVCCTQDKARTKILQMFYLVCNKYATFSSAFGVI